MLDFQPQRVGHACCFEEEEWRKLKLSKIPVRVLWLFLLSRIFFPLLEFE